jgi:hypothetical protein
VDHHDESTIIPPSILLINPFKMDVSSASNASNNTANDVGVPGVDSSVYSPPRIRQSKRKFAQVDREDDEADIDDPYAKIYRSYSANTIAHRRVHSPLRVQRRMNAAISGAEDDEESQRLFTQPPDELLPPNIFPNLQTQDNYSMTDTECEIMVDALLHNAKIDKPHPFQLNAVHHGLFSAAAIIYIIAKTGYGKTCIPATINSTRGGIAVYLVPLLGLGSDLVNKSTNLERGIESYHIDEHKNEDAEMLFNSRSTSKIRQYR